MPGRARTEGLPGLEPLPQNVLLSSTPVLQGYSMPAIPPRGFPESEFAARTDRAQRLMHAEQLDALLVMTEPEVRYFSGFLSQFWESPTRPWFLVVPSEGRPIAVIPEIGADGMKETWLDDIRTWMSPDPVDDGISLLLAVLDAIPARHGRVGVPMGAGTQLRMPAADFLHIRERLADKTIADATVLMRRLRALKSEAEIGKIRAACHAAAIGFNELPARACIGQTERDVCRAFKLEVLGAGADTMPYVMGNSGPGGYSNIVMGPSDRVLSEGDIMIIDTGSTFDGYFCDFDRNYAFGPPPADACRAYDIVYEATDAGFRAAQPGATTSDLWKAMWRVLEAGGAMDSGVGRMGHGLGMQLTEWPSNMPGDDTILEPGMVLTLEPGMLFAPSRAMVHEENIVIRPDGAEWLTPRAWPELPILDSTTAG